MLFPKGYKVFALLSMSLVACHSQDTRPSTEAPREASYEPPHVVVILADDLGVVDLGYLGATDVKTPFIDQLASDAIILSDAHVTAAVCAPSRAGLMTGRYQQRIGAECNGSPTGGANILGDVPTFADGMQLAGYQTLALGKWHLGHAEESRPLAQGFEHFSGMLGGSRSYFPVERTSVKTQIWRNDVPVDESEFSYYTDWLSDEAVRMIQQRDTERPMMMYLSYTAPHTPMHALEEDLALFTDIENPRRRTYAAMIYAMDRGIGRVLAELEVQGMADNTLIYFLSDNGGATSNGSDNGPWRGMKGSLWEGGQRVPMLVRWPDAGLVGGQMCDVMTSSLDIMASTLAAAGRADLIDTWQLDGENRFDAGCDLIDTPQPVLYWRRAVAAGVRDGDWKLWRIQEADESYRFGLVNLAEDPYEQVDLSEQEPHRLSTMAQMLAEWELGLEEPRWLEGESWQNNQRRKHDFSVVGRDVESTMP